MAKLAINGGEKVITRSLGKRWPIWDEREEKALLEVCRSGRWWGGGEGSRIWKFEDVFAELQLLKSAIIKISFGLSIFIPQKSSENKLS